MAVAQHKIGGYPGGLSACLHSYYICDTDAEKPTSGLDIGDLCYTKDQNKFYVATGATTWLEKGATEGGTLPAGIILMWHGLIANIPSGWVLCDGANGTPDLRGKFVKGAAAAAEAGDTGGALTHTHAAHPSHTHTYSQVPNHVHGVSTILRTATTGGATTQVTNAQDTSSTADATRKTDNPDGGVAQGTTDGPSASLTHDSPNHEPPFFTVLYIMKS